MTALQLQVDHLTKQLDIKDEIVRNAARDVQELRKVRTAQDLERERLEAQIETQSYQLDEANAELVRTKQDQTYLRMPSKNSSKILLPRSKIWAAPLKVLNIGVYAIWLTA